MGGSTAMEKWYWAATGALIFALLLWVFSHSETDGGNPQRAFEGRKVLVIGIDGLRPDALMASNTPNLRALMDAGAWTSSAVAGGELQTPTEQPTVSGPGWSSILTGVWVDRHRVVDNSFIGRQYGVYPHFFRRIKEIEPQASLASIVSWHPIDDVIVASAAGSADYRAKGAGATYEVRDRSVRDLAVARLGSANPDVVFLHFDQVDGAGHAYGFSPEVGEYTRAVSEVDSLIGDVLDAVRSRPGYAGEDWLVVVTTDHGGTGLSHGGQSQAEREIFLIVSGGKARPGRSDASPGHTAIPATVLAHLGLPVDPDWEWADGAFGLPPFPPANLRAEEEPDRSVVLRWEPAVELAADGLELLRNGVIVGRLSLDASSFLDRPPVTNGAEARFRYVLRVVGLPGETVALTADALLPAGPRDGLVLDLDLANAAHDASGHGNDGAVRGVPEPVEGPGLLGAMRFGGNDLLRSWVEAAESETLQFGRNTNFTVSIWVRNESEGAKMFFGTRESMGNDEPGWGLGTGQDGQGWQWSLGDGTARAEILAPQGSLATGGWSLLTAVHERYRLSRLYLDGEEAGSASIQDIRDVDSGEAVELGGKRGFVGSLAQPRVWRRALTAGEVRRLYREQRAYFDWKESVFAAGELEDPAISGDQADPDEDGLVNIVEFGWDEDPTKAGAVEEGLTIAREEGRVTLRTRVRAGGVLNPEGSYAADGLVYELEGRESALGDWESASSGFEIGFPLGEEGRPIREMVFRSKQGEPPWKLFRMRIVLWR